MRLVKVAEILMVLVSLSALLILWRKVAMGDGIPDVLQSTASSSSSSSFVVQAGTLPQFLYQWRSITSNRFVINMVKGQHLQLRYQAPSFHNFTQFDIKVAAAHHPIIQKEVDELLKKGTDIHSDMSEK